MHWLPILQWLPQVDRHGLRADAVAGLTTAVLLIPQGMGYALLAGLPPIVGLYAGVAPLIAYAILGSSRHLAVGPVALDSLLTAVAVAAVARAGSEDYVAAAVTLAAMVGVCQIVLGALGLGFVVNFLSRPVLSGFTSAAALIIAASQLTHLVGVELPTSSQLHVVLAAAFAALPSWHGLTLGMGLASVLLLLLLRARAPRLPGAMLVITGSTALVAVLSLHEHGVAIVGTVPAGLPGPALPRVDRELLVGLWPGALTIALVAFVEAISVGEQFARLGRYEVRPAQELVALGAANLASSLFGGYSVTGSFSRTALNFEAGARSQLAAVIAALFVALTLLLLTPLFFHMPKAVLAAIIVVAVSGLIDLREARRLWQVKRSDCGLLIATFVATLGLGIQHGILAGVALSLSLFVVRSTRPHIALLGHIPGTEVYLNLARHPHAESLPGILIVRIDAQFYFGNVSFLKDTLRELEASMHQPLRVVVLDAGGMNQLDSSALDALQEIDRDYSERGIRLLFSHLKGPVQEVMQRAGLLQRLEEQARVFLRTHDAVLAATGDPRSTADGIGCDPAPRK